jgi:large subunit ribosomal protein L25
MANQELKAELRTVLGKKVAQLRREGRIPGVVYGPVVEGTVPVTVDTREFQKFYQAAGHSTLFLLRWEDGQQSVFIREVQHDPVRRNPLHIDFFAPNLRRPVRAMVPVVLHNPATLSEAVLSEERTEIEVEALPATIPHQIDIDVSGLVQPGDALRIGDITFPPGVTPVLDVDELIVHVASTYRAPEPEEVAEEAAAAAEPAEEPAAAAGESDDETAGE